MVVPGDFSDVFVMRGGLELGRQVVRHRFRGDGHWFGQAVQGHGHDRPLVVVEQVNVLYAWGFHGIDRFQRMAHRRVDVSFQGAAMVPVME